MPTAKTVGMGLLATLLCRPAYLCLSDHQICCLLLLLVHGTACHLD